jgi:protein-tyrosine-phosphatase
MAEAMLRRMIERRGAAGRLCVSSAGISAWTGEAASPEACKAMELRGISLGKHRARRMQLELLEETDLVLTMTDSHKQSLQNAYSAARDKIFLFSEYAGLAGDVPDPMGGTPVEYERCAEQLARMLDGAWEKILAAAGKKEKSGEK